MGTVSTPASSEVRDQVRRIRESDTFRSAPQVSRLLTFLTDATLGGEPLKESVIGASFFNRPSGYDPQTDPVVRTEVRRLRLKLNEYYQREGAAAPVLIEIPSGAYKARFTVREALPPDRDPEILPAQLTLASPPLAPIQDGQPVVPPQAVSKPRTLPLKALAAAAVFLLVAAVWLLPRVTGHSATRSVAVLRLHDLDADPDTAWLGKALSAMIAADLSSSQSLRSIPVSDVARSRLNLSDAVPLGSTELSQLRQSLGADLVVAGSYASVGTAGAKEYRLDVQIYDARTGQLAGSASDTSDERNLFDMVSRVGAGIGQRVGVEMSDARLKPMAPTGIQLDSKALSPIELAKTLCLKAASLRNGPEKERLYLQALETGRKENSGSWEIDPLNGLARIYAGRKDFVKAADFYRQSYEVSLKSYGADHPNTAEAKVHWARSRIRLGEGKQAVQQIKEAIPVARRGLPPDSVRLWNVLHDAIHTCNDAKAFQDAESYTQEALKLTERMRAPLTSERWGMLYWDLGRAMKGEKRYAEAISALEKAEAGLKQFQDTRQAEVLADIELVKAEQRGDVTRSK